MGPTITLYDLRAGIMEAASDRIHSGELDSVRRLARRADISQPQLCNALRGRRQLSVASADRLAKVLKIDVGTMACDIRAARAA